MPSAFAVPLPLTPLRARAAPRTSQRALQPASRAPAMARRPTRPPRPTPPSPSTRAPAPPKRPRNAPPEHSQSPYRRAQDLALRRDKRAARAAFRSATAARPRDGRMWLAWAQMEARSGRMSAARDVFREGVRCDPGNVRLLHAWAVEEGRMGRTAVAHALFRRCLDIDAGDGIVWQSYALSEERNGNTAVARGIFAQGAEMDPCNVHLLSAWGVMEQRDGRLEAADELFARAIEVDERHVRTFQAWAITKERMGKLQESEELFRRALSVNERSAPTYQAYALFSARRGRLDRARELFGRGIQIDPNHAAIWHAWAVMEQREGNYEKARELFDRGVNASPNSTPMLRAWASMELELGHIDKSTDWLVPRGSRSRHNRNAKEQHAEGRKGGKEKDTRQISVVGENLKMLRLMVERRSDEDMSTVMQWLDSRARADRVLYDKLTERRENDLRKVTEWIERRSTSDIKSFKEWLNDHYAKDSRIGVYIFNWDLPPLAPASSTAVPVAESVVEASKPVEWLRLSGEQAMGLQAFDEQLYYHDKPTDYAEGIYFMGQIAGGLADRAALILVLCAMTSGLIGFSGHLLQLGYSPYGASTQVTEEDPTATPPPSGVDAHLYEDGGAESIATSSRWMNGKR